MTSGHVQVETRRKDGGMVGDNRLGKVQIPRKMSPQIAGSSITANR